MEPGRFCPPHSPTLDGSELDSNDKALISAKPDPLWCSKLIHQRTAKPVSRRCNQ